MKKVILIDGNNLLFRSYYATAYSGSILRNSKGFPTNGLYGFINMLNKIIKEECPEYMMIAFDKGKTFRHEKYEGYKDGRRETPEELKLQFPVAKMIATEMGIPCFEIDNYEADDIIGTFAKEVDINDEFISTIISSDKDLLQLISNDNEVKLLKSNDFIRMDKSAFIKTYGFTPEKMVDLKALMGDASDNIPGVKGIGEKTAIKLIVDYGSLDGVYENIDDIKGKLKEKLINDKESAYFSYELATIYKDVPIDKDLDKIKYNGAKEGLIPLLEEYEFFSILKKLDIKKEEKNIEVKEVDKINIDKDSAIYIECEGSYHDKKIIGISISNDDGNFYLKGDNFTNITFDKSIKLYTYDLKKLYVLSKYFDISLPRDIEDLMIVSYLLNYEIRDDISYLMNIFGYNGKSLTEIEKIRKRGIVDIDKEIMSRSAFIYENKDKLLKKLEDKELVNLYKKLELPLCYTLGDMEYEGVVIDKDFLIEMKDEVNSKIEEVESSIYKLAGEEFNIMSPKTLANILFTKLEIPYPKKLKANKKYSTSADILAKLTDYEIVSLVLEYRMLTKLYTNYIVGLLEAVHEDGKVHTIFTQTLTRTGRLSSINPNLQNIPAREEYGKLIRKAFVPSKGNVIIASDYSQIELRVFAHMSNASGMVEAFNNNFDIHTRTAMDIFHVTKDEVTSKMRRDAKAVNFGIIYGISSFGLSEDLNVDVKSAKKFMDDYLEAYPGIKDYMDKLKAAAYQNGYVKTLFGRVRVIDELKSSEYLVRNSGERIALNTPIQGTAADILKIAMLGIERRFKKENIKAKMIIQVHDELLFDTPKEEQDRVIEIVKDEMENVYKLRVPLKVEISAGSNWYEAK